MKKTCWCGKNVYAKELCRNHYQQSYRRRPMVRAQQKNRRRLKHLSI